MSITMTCPNCSSLSTVPDAASPTRPKCRKCGAALNVASAESHGLTSGLATAAQELKSAENRMYGALPFYRRNGFASVMVMLGIFCGLRFLFVAISVLTSQHPEFGPLDMAMSVIAGLPLTIVSLVTLTGRVYYKKIGPDGQLAAWGKGNKAVATVLLAAWLVTLVAVWSRP